MSRGLVILLHGVGSTGRDIAQLGQALAPSLPGVAFESPDAPLPFPASAQGRQWFDVAGVTEANRPGRVAAAREAFDAVVSGLVRRHGLAGELSRVALVGFSQGSIMALDALASGRWPVGLVVAFSGRLASPEPLAPATGTRLLLVHGDADRIMPVAEAGRAERLLSAKGVQVSVALEVGLGHQVSSAGIARAAEFIDRTLPASG